MTLKPNNIKKSIHEGVSLKPWEEYYKGLEEIGEGIDPWAPKTLTSLSEGDMVLDVGAGPGVFVKYIEEQLPGIKVMGIDNSVIAINKRKTNSLVLGDMRNLPFKNNTFKAIFSFSTVEHVEETEQVIKEFHRTLIKDSMVFITVPNKLSFFHITKIIRIFLGRWQIGYEKSFYPQELKNILKTIGFKDFSFFIIPFTGKRSAYIFLDDVLNRISNKKFGFFIYATAHKG